jgi:hypothetical protein
VRRKWCESGLKTIKEAVLASSQTKNKFKDFALPDVFISTYDNEKLVFSVTIGIGRKTFIL